MDLDIYQKIKTQIQSLLGINLNHYKDEQMRRRLDSWLVRSGTPNWDDYFVRVRKDENELRKLRDYLTINVTEFFRDMERWQSLRQNIFPELLKAAHTRPDGALRIWSAGCSTGAEPYTMSIILDEISAIKKHFLLATDLDRGALAKAKAGGPYAAEEVRNITPTQRSNYLKAGGPPFYINSNLIQRITFREHDLLLSPYENNFDLIVCRNVVIYFTTDTKQELYGKFSKALRPGGILFVGGTEIIPKPQEFNLRSTGFSFYVKSN